MKPNKFIDRSEFIKPVVVWKYNGSFMSDIKTFDVRHDLPFTPLIMGEYSFNSDFSDARDFRFWLSDNENFFVGALKKTIRFALRGAGTKRVYVRAIGIAPPNYMGEITPLKQQILIDSRNKSLKILNFGEFGNGDIITHNLGYHPIVYFWIETVIFREGSSSYLNMEPCLRPGSPDGVMDSNKINTSGKTPQKGYYAIFGDPINED